MREEAVNDQSPEAYDDRRANHNNNITPSGRDTLMNSVGVVQCVVLKRERLVKRFDSIQRQEEDG